MALISEMAARGIRRRNGGIAQAARGIGMARQRGSIGVRKISGAAMARHQNQIGAMSQRITLGSENRRGGVASKRRRRARGEESVGGIAGQRQAAARYRGVKHSRWQRRRSKMAAATIKGMSKMENVIALARRIMAAAWRQASARGSVGVKGGNKRATK